MKLLARIETIGNRLPHPATLFLIGTVLVFLLSWCAVVFNWKVSSPLGETLQARNLLSADGTWWLLSTMVDNFIRFPPLGIVLVGMLGIGMAEHSGLLPAILKRVTRKIANRWLTPVIMFIGIMSSIALDAGYVVLPPIAAVLYIAAGRSPLTGIAVAFAGVSAGFSANLFITAVDPLLTGFSQSAAAIIAPDYRVAVTANWWFMIVSTLVLTLTGWLVTAKWVEPRIPVTETPPQADNNLQPESADDSEALRPALLSFAILLLIIVLWVWIPGAPLHGAGDNFARWIEATVPLLFLVFVIPGVIYGVKSGRIGNNRDAANIMGRTMADLGPYIVMAFFAAQFIESFSYSGLGEMLAISGGSFLASLQLPSAVLLPAFMLLVIIANLFIGSASAKYAILAPVFVPMLMLVGFSPELTQAAYRVGDSVSNVVTPLNPYMVIILAQVQKYVRNSGMGTLVSVMLPYAIIFALVWSLLLVLWFLLGLPLGPGGQLHFNF